jgi:hypothetical protein
VTMVAIPDRELRPTSFAQTGEPSPNVERFRSRDRPLISPAVPANGRAGVLKAFGPD